MCGIVGVIPKGKNLDKNSFSAMVNSIRHRGPNDVGCCGINNRNILLSDRVENILEDLQCAFGFTRLSIQDISKNGHQPMASSDKRWVITYNGEIYNVKNLKKMLADEGISSFRGNSDTEVLLYCIQAYGVYNTLRMINGMYALAIYDCINNSVIIARDKVGIIPIYIMNSDKEIAWASEIKAFNYVKSFRKDINIISLSRSYLYCNPNDQLWREVSEVEPGTYIQISLDDYSMSCHRYHSWNEYANGDKYRDEGEVSEAFSTVFADCISRQMISDVPLGVQLSGGVDSSLVAYYAAKASSGTKVNAYSIINRYDEKFNEEQWIRKVVEKAGLREHYVYVNEDHFFDYFEKTLYAYERPLGVQSGMGIYQFANNANEQISVLLSGEGADEMCGGYGLAGSFRYSDYSSSNELFTDEFLLSFDRQINMYENGMRMINGFNLGDILQERRDFINSCEGDWNFKLSMLWGREELRCLLERQNKVCMASSVENRVPFLDDEMMKFFMKLPLDSVVNGSHNNYHTKIALKKECEKIYGHDFAFRNKMGLGYRISNQIRGKKFTSYLEELIIPGMRNRGIINMTEFYTKYNRMANGQDVLSVWKAINIEAWFQLFVDGRMPIDRDFYK